MYKNKNNQKSNIINKIKDAEWFTLSKSLQNYLLTLGIHIPKSREPLRSTEFQKGKKLAKKKTLNKFNQSHYLFGYFITRRSRP